MVTEALIQPTKPLNTTKNITPPPPPTFKVVEIFYKYSSDIHSCYILAQHPFHNNKAQSLFQIWTINIINRCYVSQIYHATFTKPPTQELQNKKTGSNYKQETPIHLKQISLSITRPKINIIYHSNLRQLSMSEIWQKIMCDLNHQRPKHKSCMISNI